MSRRIRRQGRVHTGTEADALLHPAVKSGAYLSPDEEQAALAGIEAAERAAGGGVPSDYREFADADDIAASRAGGSGAYGSTAQIQAGRYPHTDIHTTVTADTGIRAQDDYVGESAYGDYASNVGPQLPIRESPRAYQNDGRDVGAGYLNNPFDAAGRQQIKRQFLHAPLGGHVRGALEGQELFGHRITGGQARMAEQGLAGLTAVGIGVPTFLTAVHNLTTPQSAETIPM
jgi:hypothetical protein